MSEMIERVARAICREWLEADYEGEKVDRLVDRGWRCWQAVARTAIAAMREPTDDVIHSAPHWSCSECDGVNYTTNRDAWYAMIDAAMVGGD